MHLGLVGTTCIGRMGLHSWTWCALPCPALPCPARSCSDLPCTHCSALQEEVFPKLFKVRAGGGAREVKTNGRGGKVNAGEGGGGR